VRSLENLQVATFQLENQIFKGSRDLLHFIATEQVHS